MLPAISELRILKV